MRMETPPFLSTSRDDAGDNRLGQKERLPAAGGREITAAHQPDQRRSTPFISSVDLGCPALAMNGSCITDERAAE